MAAHLGLAFVGLALPATSSLKEKRAIIRSGVAHVRHKFNVSISEVGALNTYRRAELAIAAVTNCKPVTEAVLQDAVRLLEGDPRVTLEDLHVEFL
ncbi:MAG: hypothetical protein AMXMBFR61_03490 [Fimbriimonadales bacterium]